MEGLVGYRKLSPRAKERRVRLLLVALVRGWVGMVKVGEMV